MRKMLSDHFSYEEMQCPCCHEANVSPELVAKLEALRLSVGSPIPISSGYRCEKYNARLKNSSPKSRHVLGEAVDIPCTDARLAFRIIRSAMAMGFGGIGIGSNFIHLDIRSPIVGAIWTY